jgi:hypothetical protein
MCLLFDEKNEIRFERLIFENIMKMDTPFTLVNINEKIKKLRKVNNIDLVEFIINDLVLKGELNTFGAYYLPKKLRYTIEAH